MIANNEPKWRLMSNCRELILNSYTCEIIDKLLIFKRGFPGKRWADNLEGIKIITLFIFDVF